MFKYLTGILCLLFFPLLHADVEKSSEHEKVQPFEFPTKNLALEFIKKEKATGKRTNLTVQKQEKQRYSVLLKGYSQWTTAFKQAQLLEKQGFSKIEVVKGHYERGYSIIVQQSLNKKSIGKTFNVLRGLGLRNVKVHTDRIKLIRYIVMVHEPLNEKQIVNGQQPVADKASRPSSEIVKKSDTASSGQPIVEQEVFSMTQGKGEKFDDDAMIIVMSDSSDITYEISLDEGNNSNDSNFEWAVDKAVLETEIFTRSSSTVDHVQYGHAAGHLKWHLLNHWEIQLAASIDGNYQHGDSVSDSDELELDYGDTYLLYRDQSMRLTFGSDTVRWGRVDIFAPTDNMAALDLTRGVLYEWGEGYRSTPIVRGEFFFKKSKLDLIYLPYFREAELPDEKNVWHPVNVNEGGVLGFGSTPMLKTLLQHGKIDDNISESDGGFGIRYGANIDSFDFDLTVQRVKLSAPYYQVNPAIVSNPSLINQEKYSLIERHPRSWVIGGDVEFQIDSILLRFESAWFSDLPATTQDLKYETYEGFKWVAGAEFYPGDGDTRVNLQLSGSHINEEEKILDRDNIVILNGEVESLFANNRWQARGRFFFGLDEKDIYISPEIAYLGWEPYEIYTAIHYLDGDDETIGGFYEKNSMLTIGWRGQF